MTTRPQLLEMLWRDALYAFRAMRQNPGYSATAILTLALAIGGTTTMFTVIRAVLLSPLPYPDSDRLVDMTGGATPSRFTEMRAGANSLLELGAFTGEENLTLSGIGEPEVLKGARVSGDFLRILNVNAVKGRSFRDVEDSPGGPPVAMISAELWRRQFGGDPEIAGRTAVLAGTPYTIIGVLPPHFQFPSAGLDVWMTDPAEWPAMPAKSRAMSPFLSIFGRLRPGVSLGQANAEMKVIRSRYAMTHPSALDAKSKNPLEVAGMREQLVGDTSSMLWMLFGAVAFVLLIACANVASLLLARAAYRSREMALRAALGAGVLRLTAQLLGECVWLSLCGGLFGALLAAWGLQAIPKITSFDLPRAGEIHFDWTVFAFAGTLSIGTGLLFGLTPSLSASRPDLMRLFRASGEAASQGLARRVLPVLNLRELLLVSQVALSIVLLMGAGLLIESVSRMRDVNVGFNADHLLTATISLDPVRYDTDSKRAVFFQDVTRDIRLSPGIRDVAAAMFLPMMNYAGTPVQDAATPLLKLNERPIATMSAATPGYFRTLQIPLERGRDFNDRDREDTQRVAIIDEALARRFWPAYPHGPDPVGRHIWVGGLHPKPAEVIGVAANVHQMLENTAWPETVYVAFAQSPQPFAALAVQTTGNPLAFASAIRAAVRRLDRNQTISAVETMNDLVDEQMGKRRLLSILLASFAAMALLLVLIGIYGSIAYSVAQRTAEMGIRRALGAQQKDILQLILRQSLRVAMVGVGIGMAGAVVLTRILGSLLFHVSPTDPVTFAIVVLLFLLIASVAAYIPARRATRIDPVAALRIS